MINAWRNRAATALNCESESPIVSMLDHATIKTRSQKSSEKIHDAVLYLRTYIIREKFAGDHLKLYERYFKKGKLAASISTRKLAHDLEIDKKTVMHICKRWPSTR